MHDSKLAISFIGLPIPLLIESVALNFANRAMHKMSTANCHQPLNKVRDAKYIAGSHSELEENWLTEFSSFAPNTIWTEGKKAFARELNAFRNFVKDSPIADNIKVR